MTEFTSNTLTKSDPYQPQELEVRVCPICGSTELRAIVMTSVSQQPDGTWTFDNPDEEDLRLSMKSPNAEVRCGNPLCGDPVDPATGQVIVLEHHDPYQAWLVHCQGLPSDTEMTPEMKKQAEEWFASLLYEPWEGIIADTHVL